MTSISAKENDEGPKLSNDHFRNQGTTILENIENENIGSLLLVTPQCNVAKALNLERRMRWSETNLAMLFQKLQGAPVNEGDRGSDTFKSHFSILLSAQVPIFKFLSVLGHNLSYVRSMAIKMRFCVSSRAL